jgi:hypothetical protein
MFKSSPISSTTHVSGNVYRNLSILIPILFGIWASLLGADTNWDLLNYHLYNPFALFNGKLNIDLAPGGFQTYFNPVLDIPYYLMIQNLDARFAAFLLGTFHGINFVLLLHISRLVVIRILPSASHWIPVLLALSGCLTGNFISELGNTMGDNATAVFCLGAILSVLYAAKDGQARTKQRSALILLSGLLIGMGVGLKLTNAPYAVALGIGLLVLEGTAATRMLLMVCFGIGVVLGIAITNGYWFYTMWTNFGNPLFPQFGNIFPNPIAASVSVADKTWLPKGIWQYVSWPFIISIYSKKAGQLLFYQIVWAMVYPLMILALAKKIFQRKFTSGRTSLDASARYILVVVATGFFIWMMLFSIYRYLIPMDLLTPLAIFILLNYLLPHLTALRASKWLLGISTAVAFVGGVHTWQHAPWSKDLIKVEVPPLTAPENTTVLITEGNPWSWLALKFPVQVAFIQIVGNFPKGPGFDHKVEDILKRRAGPTYALFQGHGDSLPEASKDIAAANRAERASAQKALDRFDLVLHDDECTMHRAGIGASTQLYQWCPVGTRR